MANPQESTPRTERVMIRLTQEELAYVESRARARSRRASGLTKADGSVNLSASIRHVLLDGFKAPK